MPLEVMIRFGLWDEILAEPETHTDKMWFTRAFHHAAQAIAYAAKGDTARAHNEQRIFVDRAKLMPKEASLGNNSCEAILGVVTPVVEGEILVAESHVDRVLISCARRSKRRGPSNMTSRPHGSFRCVTRWERC